MFPATDEDQWSLIKQAIDESDHRSNALAGSWGLAWRAHVARSWVSRSGSPSDCLTGSTRTGTPPRWPGRSRSGTGGRFEIVSIDPTGWGADHCLLHAADAVGDVDHGVRSGDGRHVRRTGVGPGRLPDAPCPGWCWLRISVTTGPAPRLGTSARGPALRSRNRCRPYWRPPAEPCP
jgi:hypothetical protein